MSKRPKTRQDYHVLFGSGDPASYPWFEQRIRQHAPGNPARDGRGRPGALPWVTLGPGEPDENGQRLIGMAVLQWSKETDLVGRPIAPTCYWCAEFADFAALRGTCAGLYDTVKNQWPGEADAGSTVLLPLPSPDPDTLAASIDDVYGFEWAAAVAALLLDGDIAVTGAGRQPPEWRLDCADAVAALLPYGFRADLSVGTWAQPGVPHRIRLVFTSRPQPGQCPVGLGMVPDVGGSGVAADYLERLQRARQRHGTAGVVAHLAEHVTPCSFERAETALEVIEQLDLGSDRIPTRAHAGKTTGADDAGDRVTASGGDPLFPAHDEHARRLEQLVLRAEEQDLKTLDAEWDRKGDALGGTLVPMLARALRDSLTKGAIPHTAERFVELVARRELLPQFLALVVRPPAAGAPPTRNAAAPDRHQETAAKFLRWWDPPRPGAWAGVRDVLREEPGTRIGLELLTQELESGRTADAERWLAWLADGDPPGRGTFQPFRAALGGQRSATGFGDVETVSLAGPHCLAALLSAAERTGQGLEAVDAATAVLLRDAHSFSGKAERQIAEVLTRLAGMAPERQGGLDILRAAFGIMPVLWSAPSDVGDYLRGFAAGWATAADAAPSRDDLVVTFADRALRHAWGTSANRDPADRDRLLGVLERHAGTEARVFLAAVEGTDDAGPGITLARLGFQFRSRPVPAWTTYELGRICADGLADHATPRGVVRTVRPWLYERTPRGIYGLLRMTGRALARKQAQPPVPDAYETLTVAILSGAAGLTLAKDYKAWYRRVTRVERHRLELLLRMARGIDPRTGPASHAVSSLPPAIRRDDGTSVAELDRSLYEYLVGLEKRHATKYPLRDYQATVGWVLEGGLGETTARMYREWIMRVAPAEIDRAERLLEEGQRQRRWPDGLRWRPGR